MLIFFNVFTEHRSVLLVMIYITIDKKYGRVIGLANYKASLTIIARRTSLFLSSFTHPSNENVRSETPP